jgi:hypothetical protein
VGLCVLRVRSVAMGRLAVALVMACMVAAGCGGAGARPGMVGAGSAAMNGSGDPLVGDWWGTLDMGTGSSPCPIEIEIFADGTAEANFMSDDGPDAQCGFGLVLAVREQGPNGPIVRLGGELSACLWRREGELLRLACEDHDRVPSSFDYSFVLTRRPDREISGHDALVGHWRSASFFGTATDLTIAEDDSLTFGEQRGRVSDVDDQRVTLHTDTLDQRCLYRATEDRLTLRCADRGADAPADFLGARPPSLVFRRLDRAQPAAPPAPRTEPAAPAAREGSGHADGGRSAGQPRRVPQRPRGLRRPRGRRRLS